MIDLIFLVFIVIGVIKGIQRGFIIAIFSILAIIIGLAAAMKLSTVVAGYMEDSMSVSAKWLPVISFVLVFVVVVILVRLVANLLQKTVEVTFLGWVNRIAGVLLYTFLYTIVFSILLFFAGQLQLMKPETITDSRIYPWVEPIGPYVINGVGKIFPLFRDMFQTLTAFFADMSKQVAAKW